MLNICQSFLSINIKCDLIVIYLYHKLNSMELVLELVLELELMLVVRPMRHAGRQ